jgi:hypothetical protein
MSPLASVDIDDEKKFAEPLIALCLAFSNPCLPYLDLQRT